MRLGARSSSRGDYIVLECGCMSVTVELWLLIGFIAYFFSLLNENHVLVWSYCWLSWLLSFSDSFNIEGWHLPSSSCPCRGILHFHFSVYGFTERVCFYRVLILDYTGPLSPITKQLCTWKDYFEWRKLPLDSPVALLLHWVITVFLMSNVISSMIRMLEVFFFLTRRACFYFSHLRYIMQFKPLGWEIWLPK